MPETENHPAVMQSEGIEELGALVDEAKELDSLALVAGGLTDAEKARLEGVLDSAARWANLLKSKVYATN